MMRTSGAMAAVNQVSVPSARLAAGDSRGSASTAADVFITARVRRPVNQPVSGTTLASLPLESLQNRAATLKKALCERSGGNAFLFMRTLTYRCYY